ncbi:MAG: hypothetical protein J2P17_09820 [Mycobacterium sp.]|nr:hypothetical protein [Mycobacterium sp.]
MRYDEDVVTGAKVLSEPEISDACVAEIARLWRQGEDLADFLTRTGVLADTRERS